MPTFTISYNFSIMFNFLLTHYSWSRICILMYDTVLLKKEKKYVVDCNYVYLDDDLVKFINEEITFDAVDEVYSIDGDWYHLKNFCKRYKLPLRHKPYSVN